LYSCEDTTWSLNTSEVCILVWKIILKIIKGRIRSPKV
jgi:hypothetical protein